LSFLKLWLFIGAGAGGLIEFFEIVVVHLFNEGGKLLAADVSVLLGYLHEFLLVWDNHGTRGGVEDDKLRGVTQHLQKCRDEGLFYDCLHGWWLCRA
jgi:hypothetical protein